ncbi:MAG: hypothetical protein ACI36Y_00015 [Coriobacteriales bacterium]
MDFEVPEEMERMEPAYETQIYRIIQEALLNSCKYSGADRALVQINDAGSSFWQTTTRWCAPASG